MIIIKRTEADVHALAGAPPVDINHDGRDWLGIKVEKPWGHEIEKYRDAHCSLTVLCVKDAEATSMHCHVHKTTTLYVFKGYGFINTLDGARRISVGDVAVIEKGAFHQIVGGEGIKLFEFETPANKNDLVRLTDRYGRGQGYERVECAKVLSAD